MNKSIVVTGIPCHYQAIERTIKYVTAASKIVYSHKSRHEMILQTNISRIKLPSVQSKADC